MSKPVLVNVGCGRVWHRDWINLDHRPSAPEVRAFDLRKPLPFGDDTVDAVYASHVLEHLDPAEGRRLLAECRRILKPGGIARIVVPDFEELCRFYLQRLSAVVDRSGAENAQAYDWAYLQLLDQHVRRRPGGELMAYLKQPGLAENPVLHQRLSREVRDLGPGVLPKQPDGVPQAPPSGLQALRAAIGRSGKLMLRKVLPAAAVEALETARFLRTGEVHRIGYDRFSLPRLLQNVGFADVTIVTESQSAIAGFAAAGLDAIDGVARKPGSLFVEARLAREATGRPARPVIAAAA